MQPEIGADFAAAIIERASCFWRAMKGERRRAPLPLVGGPPSVTGGQGM